MRKAMIALVLAVLASTLFAAESYADGKGVATSLSLAKQYISMNPDHTLNFNYAKAKRAGLSSFTLQIGRDCVAYNNQIVNEIKKNGIYSAKANPVFAKKFEPFFLYMATGTSGSGGSSPKSSMSYMCGGDQSHPHTCYNRVWLSSPPYTAQSQVMAYVQNTLGYHVTYWPGCYSGSCWNDFTKWVQAYDCPVWGAFRSQAQTYKNNTAAKWYYWTQGPEPNPEVFSYNTLAISPLWIPYVQWWHQSYCN